jgi:hypothetical protein
LSKFRSDQLKLRTRAKSATAQADKCTEMKYVGLKIYFIIYAAEFQSPKVDTNTTGKVKDSG